VSIVSFGTSLHVIKITVEKKQIGLADRQTEGI